MAKLPAATIAKESFEGRTVIRGEGWGGRKSHFSLETKQCLETVRVYINQAVAKKDDTQSFVNFSERFKYQ